MWLLCTSAAPRSQREALHKAGVEIIEVAAAGDGRVDVAGRGQALGDRGLTRVLVEGGGQVAAAFLKADLIDRLTSYQAGWSWARDSRSAVGPLGFKRLDFAPRFSLVSARSAGRRGGNLDERGIGRGSCSPASSPTSARSPP